MLSKILYFFFLLFTVASSAALQQVSSPKIISLAAALSIPDIEVEYNISHSFCKYEAEINDVYMMVLFCRANSMELRCNADAAVTERILMDEEVSPSEINQVCHPSTIKVRRPLETSCRNHKFHQVAQLICNLYQLEKNEDLLTNWAMKTTTTLPNRLESIKTDKHMSDQGKERLMKFYISSHPRYLWAAYSTREKFEKNEDVDQI